MNVTKFAAFAAALLIGTAVFTAPTAQASQLIAADQTTSGTVIAQDQTSQLRAQPTGPRAVTVTTTPGARVTLATKNRAPQSTTANANGQARFTKLTAGARYTVRADGKTTTVTPVVNVGKASDLTVMTTDQVDAVDLTWAHKSTKARGGRTIGYTVTATPSQPNAAADAELVITVEASTKQVELTGLDPTIVYSFSVTPHNAIGNGKPSIARMSRSLADITGISTPVAESNDDAQSPHDNANPEPAPAPGPQPAPRPGPQPAPKPNTKTIWVCPDGWADVSGVCTQTQAYTYSKQTETSPYTYSPQFVETGRVWHDDPYNPFNGCRYTVHGDRCMGWEIQGYTTQAKNPAPAGWTDNGSAYERQVDVKNPTPAGWSDNGSEWIRTTAKVEKVVPA